MATQRYISTSFWDDKWIMELDPSEKLLYLYLLTNPLTNIAGIYKITIKRISFDTGFTVETVAHIFEKFEKANKAHLVGEYALLPSWPKHQHWQTHDKIRAGILIELNKLPEDILAKAVEYEYAFEIPKEIYSQIASDSLTEPRNYSDSDSDSNIDTDTPKRGVFETTYSQEFETWWTIYPRKADKKAAFTKYKATKRKGATAEMLRMAAIRYADVCNRERKEQRYILLPKTFLGPDCYWLDHYNNAEQVRRAEVDVKKPKAARIQPELTPAQIEANRVAVAKLFDSMPKKMKIGRHVP